MSPTFEEARAVYANRAPVKSAHTLQAYLRAADLFIAYLGDKGFQSAMPLRRHTLPTGGEYRPADLSAEDVRILCEFADWLQTPGDNRRPYAKATVALRLAGDQRWFEFLAEQNWIGAGFPLSTAEALLKPYLQAEKEEKISKAAEVAAHTPADLDALLTYYDHQQPTRQTLANQARYEAWELTRLRNCALLKTLAETGGQISAILSLNVSAVGTVSGEAVLEIPGKSEHTYPIQLKDSLPAIQAYLSKRAIPPGEAEKTPLFASHDPRFNGQRMSRIIAWRIVQRAAKAVKMPDVSPHDLRHYRAQQLINAGVPLKEVQERLGHRSLHTIRTFYGRILEEGEEEIGTEQGE